MFWILLSHKSSFVCFNMFSCFNILLVKVVILIGQIDQGGEKKEKKQMFFYGIFFRTYRTA